MNKYHIGRRRARAVHDALDFWKEEGYLSQEQYDSLAAKVKNYGLSQAPVPYEDIVKNVR